MRWEMGRRSRNIEDRRGMGSGGGLGRGVRVGGMGGLGILVLALVGMFLGVDPGVILNNLPIDDGSGGGYSDSAPAEQQGGGAPPQNDRQAQFVATVLAQTEDTWGALFQQMGRRYEQPQLVLFDGVVQSACGIAQSATGPFYCPADRKVYLDLSFFRELDSRFQAPGDFAQAYVVAHEVGHHVQTLLGISGEVNRVRAGVGEAESNQLSVMTELQADCFAGVWANHTQQREKVLEPGDVDEALGAASAVGDDRIQAQSRGYVVPDSFTHGSSEQRMRWFQEGFASGDLNRCDTFNAPQL